MPRKSTASAAAAALDGGCFFGSVLRDDCTPASALDLLVEDLPSRHPGLMLFRAAALATALPIYEQA